MTDLHTDCLFISTTSILKTIFLLYTNNWKNKATKLWQELLHVPAFLVS
jgi:hypothetical protein